MNIRGRGRTHRICDLLLRYRPHRNNALGTLLRPRNLPEGGAWTSVPGFSQTPIIDFAGFFRSPQAWKAVRSARSHWTPPHTETESLAHQEFPVLLRKIPCSARKIPCAALIDAPPRLAAGAINAFCASTHLLVPTVYDLLSAEAIGTFLNGVQILKAKLNPGIDLLGIIGMLTTTQGDLSARPATAKSRAKQQVMQAWGANHHFFDRHIPRRAAIAAAAGEDIAYLCDATVKGWFDELGAEISERLGFQGPRPSESVRQSLAPERAVA